MRWPSQKAIWLTIVGSCSLLVIGLSSTRVLEAFYLLPGNHIYEKAFSGGDVTDQELARAIETRESAVAIGGGAVATQLGALRLRLAERKGFGSSEGRDLLKSANSALIDGLSRSPSDPYSWFRVARIERLLRTPGFEQRLSKALVMSYYAGRFDPFVINSRFRFALGQWDILSEEARELTLDQVRLVWEFAPYQIIDLAHSKKYLTIIESGLSTDEEALEQINLKLKKDG